MWYWYVLGAVAFIIGFVLYSCLVVAGRAEDRRDAIEREEAIEVQPCDSDSDMELYLKDNSGKKVLPLASVLRTRTSPTIVKRFSR